MRPMHSIHDPMSRDRCPHSVMNGNMNYMMMWLLMRLLCAMSSSIGSLTLNLTNVYFGTSDASYCDCVRMAGLIEGHSNGCPIEIRHLCCTN